jgi:hypothetical protein
MISDRLSRLSTLALDLAGLVAIIGQEFYYQVLLLASGIEEGIFVNALA